MREMPLVSCIDDDESVRDAIEGFLKAFGFSVAVFPSAESFLEAGDLMHTSCLITDVKLNGMSGIQLLLRLAELGCRIPSIVVTAFADDETREQAIAIGAVCFLAKPVAKEELLTCIHAAVKRQLGEEY